MFMKQIVQISSLFILEIWRRNKNGDRDRDKVRVIWEFWCHLGRVFVYIVKLLI